MERPASIPTVAASLLHIASPRRAPRSLSVERGTRPWIARSKWLTAVFRLAQRISSWPPFLILL